MALTGIADLDLEILMNLPDRDLLNYCSTSKDIYNMCNNDHFWRKRFIKRFGSEVSKYKPDWRNWKNHYMQVVIDLDRFSNNPWEFLRHIQWNEKFEDIYFLHRPSSDPIPIIEAPGWVITNFYLLEIPKFEYQGVEYPLITPAKLFEVISKGGHRSISGFMINLNKYFYSY